jgi:hypothetical protein
VFSKKARPITAYRCLLLSSRPWNFRYAEVCRSVATAELACSCPTSTQHYAPLYAEVCRSVATADLACCCPTSTQHYASLYAFSSSWMKQTLKVRYFFIGGPQSGHRRATTTPEVDRQCWRHWAERHGVWLQLTVRGTVAQVLRAVRLSRSCCRYDINTLC